VRAYTTGSTYVAYKQKKRPNKAVAARTTKSFLAGSSDDTDGDADDEYDNTCYCDTTHV
jgi:hypothetical protein